MDADIVFGLLAWIDPLFAQEKMMDLKIADFPYTKKQARDKIHKGLYKCANPMIIEEGPKPLTTEDLSRLLNER